jgi:hypothetical protein
MTHAQFDQPGHRHGDAQRQSGVPELVDARHPDDAFLRREIEDDRRGEHVLLVKTLIAGLVVAALVVARQLLFV